ncbi:hypothetical protein GCM10010191_58950 [Actinomadura vinacea]|uniref:Uncharacterized protein n=1 Tax=Actinomadura vinacea TaxID=115336 RepID=A0ABP5WXF0_9ACTN
MGRSGAPRVVDHDVKTAEVSADPVGQRGGLLVVGQVDVGGGARSEVVYGLIEGVLVQVGEGQARSCVPWAAQMA